MIKRGFDSAQPTRTQLIAFLVVIVNRSHACLQTADHHRQTKHFAVRLLLPTGKPPSSHHILPGQVSCSHCTKINLITHYINSCCNARPGLHAISLSHALEVGHSPSRNKIKGLVVKGQRACFQSQDNSSASPNGLPFKNSLRWR